MRQTKVRNKRNTNKTSASWKVSLGSDQPLKPRSVSPRGLALMVVVTVIVLMVAIPNRIVIARYLNPPLEAVRLESEMQRVSENEVRSLLAAYMNSGFFNTDVSRVQESIETHPWIARAAVRRLWPGTLVLNITEEVGIARWGENQLLNQYGEIFSPLDVGPQSLPLLEGPPDQQESVMEQYQTINQLLFSVGLGIDRLTLSERGSWELILDNGIQVIAGKGQVREKVKRLIAIYDKRIRNDIAVIERIDLRYSNGIAVKKKAEEKSSVAVR